MKARMVNNMEKLRNAINTILGWACVFVFAVMVVVGTYQIVVRYFFNNPSTDNAQAKPIYDHIQKVNKKYEGKDGE